MSWTLLATRMVLSVVFVAAGFAKLLDPKGSQKAIKDFGMPSWAAGPLGIGLPVAEIIAAFLLLFVRSAWMGALGALALLLVFSVVIAVNVALGRRPACHCFGQVHSEPVGWSTVARNGGLAFLAAVLVWQGRTNPGASMRTVIRDFTAGQLLAGTFGLLTLIAVATLSWLVLHLFRQNGRLLLRIEGLEATRVLTPQHGAAHSVPFPSGLPIGSPAPRFELRNVQGGRTTLETFISQAKPLLLIFTDPNCGPCNALAPHISTWQRTLAKEVNVVLISHGRDADNRAKAAEYHLLNVLIETSKRNLAKKYNALGTPTAIAISADGMVRSYPVSGADMIRRFVEYKAWTDSGLAAFMRPVPQVQSPSVPKPVLPIGSAAPAFSAPDLEGKPVDLTVLSGDATVLLFWNPGCGFCQKMIHQLATWETNKGAGSPRLVLVSSGSFGVNREMGLHSTVLLDDEFSIGKTYQASGTPSAVLIDANGTIASTLAVGAPAVMALLGQGDSGHGPAVMPLALATSDKFPSYA